MLTPFIVAHLIAFSSFFLLSICRSIVTSKSFFDVNCNELRPTNMYVVLKPKIGGKRMGDQFIDRHGNLKLPASCRITHINIQNDLDTINLNCCQNLNIFNDMSTPNHATNLKKSKTETKIDSEDCPCPSDCASFYECKIVVKGFKDQLVKGQSIWINNMPS